MSKILELPIPPSNKIKKLEPWKVIDWRDDQLRSIYKSWNSYLARHAKVSVGTRYSDEALKLDPGDWKSLLMRSQTKRNDARAKDSLVDSLKAKNIFKREHPNGKCPEIDFEISEGLLEANQFEETKMHIHASKDHISASQSAAMQKRSLLVNRLIGDALSNETMQEVDRLINKTLKELANQPEYPKPDCDVLSILEKEENILSPLERRRRERVFQTINQAYLQSSWKDITFLKEMRDNRDLLLEQSLSSTQFLRTLINDRYKTVRNFTKMLHARQPMYSLNTKRFPNKEVYNEHQQANLFRIQYHTRRNMFKVLENIRLLIKRQDLAKLTSFVEDVMDSYVAYKTQRIMPWSFEFINEVYNFLGLALIKEYKIPSKLKTLQGRTELLTLLNIPQSVVNASKRGSATIIKIAREKTTDDRAELYKQRIARFESRMRFAKHSIERSYLYYAAAQANLEYHSFDRCCLLARKSINEARKGNHYMWAALSALVACKAHTVLGEAEHQKRMLIMALKFAKRLKNIDLILFVDICLKVNTEEMELKRTHTASELSVKRRTRASQDATISGSLRTNQENV